MSQPLNRQALTINNVKNNTVGDLLNREPFDEMQKPSYVSSQVTSRAVLVMIASIYTIIAACVGYLSFLGASFKYGVPIAVVVGFFTFAAIILVWYVALKHETISKVWKIGIIVFELLIMGFDVYISAAGWNLREIITLAESKAYERRDEYTKFYDETKAVYSGVSQLQQQAATIAKDEAVENGGKGKIYRIATTIDQMLSKDSISRIPIKPEIPSFATALTLKELNSGLMKYHDIFRSEEAELKAELTTTIGTLQDQSDLASQETDLNEFQSTSVRYLNELLSTAIQQAQAVADKKILPPVMSDKELAEASKDGVKMRILAAVGLLFFLALLSILTWPRTRKRGAEDPYTWFESMLLQHHLGRLRIPFGYDDEQLVTTRFGSIDDDLLELLRSDESMRARISSSRLTYLKLRRLYVSLGVLGFLKAFSTSGGWTVRQIEQLLDNPLYENSAPLIIQKLTYNQFTEIITFRPDGGIEDVISRSDTVSQWYCRVVERTKHKLVVASQRHAFVDRFMNTGREDDEFYEKLLLAIDFFNASQLNELLPQFVDTIPLVIANQILSLFDTVNGTFSLYQNQWSGEDSGVINEMITRDNYNALAALVEQTLRLDPRLWAELKSRWTTAARGTGRGPVAINTKAADDLSKVRDLETIRTGLVSVFTT